MPKYTIKPIDTKKLGKSTENASKKPKSPEPKRAIPTVAPTSKKGINADVRKTAGKGDTVSRGKISFVMVKSSNLKGFFHDSKKRLLYILFNTNRTYLYRAVPDNVVVGLANASSKGVYFNQHIRYKYTNKEVKNL